MRGIAAGRRSGNAACGWVAQGMYLLRLIGGEPACVPDATARLNRPLLPLRQHISEFYWRCTAERANHDPPPHAAYLQL